MKFKIMFISVIFLIVFSNVAFANILVEKSSNYELNVARYDATATMTLYAHIIDSNNNVKKSYYIGTFQGDGQEPNKFVDLGFLEKGERILISGNTKWQGIEYPTLFSNSKKFVSILTINTDYIIYGNDGTSYSLMNEHGYDDFLIYIYEKNTNPKFICVDSDNSFNQFVKGVTKGFSNDEFKELEDYCKDENTLQEYGCVSSYKEGILLQNIGQKEFSCDCQNGACVTQGTYWTNWHNFDSPGGEGDFELIKDLKSVCKSPKQIDCKTVNGENWQATGQKVTCNTDVGFYCYNKYNSEGCYDYKVRFLCSTEDEFSDKKEILPVIDNPPKIPADVLQSKYFPEFEGSININNIWQLVRGETTEYRALKNEANVLRKASTPTQLKQVESEVIKKDFDNKNVVNNNVDSETEYLFGFIPISYDKNNKPWWAYLP